MNVSSDHFKLWDVTAGLRPSGDCHSDWLTVVTQGELVIKNLHQLQRCRFLMTGWWATGVTGSWDVSSAASNGNWTQGQWWAVTVRCCTFSVNSVWHFTTKCALKGPYYTFNDAVPTCDYCPQCSPSAVTRHDWDVLQGEFINPADDRWSLDKYNESVSTAFSCWPKCRVYISRLLSCFYTKTMLCW